MFACLWHHSGYPAKVIQEDFNTFKVGMDITQRCHSSAGEKLLLLFSGVACEEKKEKNASCLFHMKKKIVYTYERFCS